MGGIGQGQATEDVVLQFADQFQAGLQQHPVAFVIDIDPFD